MPEHYRKVDLSDDSYVEFISMIGKVEHYVYSIFPTAKECSVWWVSDNNTPIALFYNAETTGLDVQEMIGVNWADLCLAVPTLIDFFKKYSLAYTFAKGFDNVYHPHRHTYPLSSKWSLTFLEKNAENSPVKFHSVKDAELYEDHEHQLRPGAETEVIEEVIVDSGEVYSFNAWQWHNWIPNHEKTEYTVFALDSVVTKEQMMIAIDKIEEL